MHAKVWLRHCSQRCHLRTAVRQGWVCLSDIPCSRCSRSWFAAGYPNLCRNMKLRLHQLDHICSWHSQFRFHWCRIDITGGRSLAKKYSKIARFGTHFGGAWGILPRSGTNHTHRPYIDKLQILSSLCIARHDFATAIKGATSEQLRDRVWCVFPIYSVQGVRTAGLQLASLIYAGMWNSG